jgi:hypothetical protein
VSGGRGTVTVTATITDNLAGVAASSNSCSGYDYTSSATQVRFRSPSGGQFRGRIAAWVSGDTYELAVTIRE